MSRKNMTAIICYNHDLTHQLHCGTNYCGIYIYFDHGLVLDRRRVDTIARVAQVDPASRSFR